MTTLLSLTHLRFICQEKEIWVLFVKHAQWRLQNLPSRCFHILPPYLTSLQSLTLFSFISHERELLVHIYKQSQCCLQSLPLASSTLHLQAWHLWYILPNSSLSAKWATNSATFKVFPPTTFHSTTGPDVPKSLIYLRFSVERWTFCSHLWNADIATSKVFSKLFPCSTACHDCFDLLSHLWFVLFVFLHPKSLSKLFPCSTACHDCFDLLSQL